MLFNHPRALARMDALGLDALVAGVARNVHYASGFWTRNFEWGSQEALAAVIIPRDPAKPPTLIVPEFAIGNLLETPTWMPQVRVTEFLNTSLLAQVPEPVENPATLEGERDAGEDGGPVLPFRDDAGPADDRQQANHRQQGEQRVEHMPAGLHRCRRACRSFEIVHGGACYDSPHPP
jgi:Xaa-Pro aminopeptidase